MIILIDNYDSFTFNLYHFLGDLGVETVVHRNDKIGVGQVIPGWDERLVGRTVGSRVILEIPVAPADPSTSSHAPQRVLRTGS